MELSLLTLQKSLLKVHAIVVIIIVDQGPFGAGKFKCKIGRGG